MENVETADKATLDSKPISDLKVRLALLTQIIKEAQKAGDKRWKEADRQHSVVLDVLSRKIEEAWQGVDRTKPEPIVIGMQPARLKAKRL